MDSDPCGKIWWTQPRAATGRHGIQIKPYFADVSVENLMLEEMAELSKRIHQNPNYPLLFNETNRPDELRWFYSKLPEKARNLPDIFKAHTGAIIISEAMRDVLVQFDLGTSQILELPLYELSVMTKRGLTVPDRSKQDPRRWFLLHIAEYKPSVLIEASENLHKQPIHEREVYIIHSGEEQVIALDGQIAGEGPHIWLDLKLRGITFFSDPLKRAIEEAKLRTPILKFKPCSVFSVPPEPSVNPASQPSIRPDAPKGAVRRLIRRLSGRRS